MKKRMQRLLPLVLAAWCAGMALTGCQSDGYYQDRAVQRARKFLIEEIPEMPLAEQEYIKFNRPFFLVSPMSPNQGTGLSEICISWMVPDNPDVYMVFGVSGYRMIDWTPERVIRKNFQTTQEPYRRSVGPASEYILQNMYGLLSVKSINRIRYSMPGVWKCTFPLDSNPEIELDAEMLEKASKLPRYALAWLIEENGETRYVAQVGTAKDDSLVEFKPYFAAIFSEADFRAGTIGGALIEPFGGETAEEAAKAAEAAENADNKENK